MTEQQDQGQDSSQESQNNTQSSSTGNQQERQQSSSERNNQTEDRSIPYHRFKEVNDAKRSLEERMSKIEEEREQAEEAKAQEKGEFQKIADRWKTKAEKLENELRQERESRTRERRLNVWNEAAQGIVRSEAITDAFKFVSPTELDSIDDNDPEQYKPLAQALVESKPYFGADGPRGAGSGGSRTPVQTFANGSVTRDRSSIFQNKNKRKQWK